MLDSVLVDIITNFTYEGFFFDENYTDIDNSEFTFTLGVRDFDSYEYTCEDYHIADLSRGLIPAVCHYLDSAFRLGLKDDIDKKFTYQKELSDLAQAYDDEVPEFAVLIFRKLNSMLKNLISYYKDLETINPLTEQEQKKAQQTIKASESALRRLEYKSQTKSLFPDIEETEEPTDAFLRMAQLHKQ